MEKKQILTKPPEIHPNGIVKELKHYFKTTIYKLAQLQKETNQ